MEVFRRQSDTEAILIKFVVKLSEGIQVSITDDRDVSYFRREIDAMLLDGLC